MLSKIPQTGEKSKIHEMMVGGLTRQGIAISLETGCSGASFPAEPNLWKYN